MTEYPVKWVDYQLPSGEKCSAAFCTYNNKVRHFVLGEDSSQHRMLREAKIEEAKCDAAEYCLARECPFNKTSQEQLLHMLDMYKDEPLGGQASEMWNTSSTLEAMLGVIKRIEAGELDKFRIRDCSQ